MSALSMFSVFFLISLKRAIFWAQLLTSLKTNLHQGIAGTFMEPFLVGSSPLRIW